MSNIIDKSNAKIISLYNKGLSDKEIAFRLNLTPGCVAKRREKLRLPGQTRKFIDYTEIDKMIVSGATNAQIKAAHPDKWQESRIALRRKKLGFQCKRKEYVRPDGKEHRGLPDGNDPAFIPFESRFLAAKRARAKALNMDIHTFEAVWMPGKTWTLEEGFV